MGEREKDIKKVKALPPFGANCHVFWQWCREKVQQGHDIFVSEYQAPEDFICVWEKQVNSSLTKNTGAKKNVERLFQHRSQRVI